jgi:hypothetical protein
MRSGAPPLVSLAGALALAACASTPPHYPSETAMRYIGKPLFDLEMHWSAPSSISTERASRQATWRFDQYNLAGCSVTVHTDDAGVIRKVSWTQGCGPKSAARGSPRARPGK